MDTEMEMYLLNVAGKPLVEVLHVLFLLLPRTLDGRHSGLRHHGVCPGRCPHVAEVTRSLRAADGGAWTRVGCTIDDQMSRSHHRFVDGRRRVRLVRRPRLVRGCPHAGGRAFGRTFTGDAHLGHVD